MDAKRMTKDLAPLFSPRSVAVVGASRRPGSVGGAVLANLIKGGFEGPVYPVNRGAAHVRSLPAFPDLASLPQIPDLAVVAVPAQDVLAVVEEAARVGVRAAAVLTAGFSETSHAGRELERKMVEAARAAGMVLLGPNCLGVQNSDPHVRLDATFGGAFAGDGRVAFASQSGALGVAALEYADELGLGFSLFASLGNKADLSGNDLLEHFEGDERTRVVLLYLESIGNPVRFRELTARVGRTKPILLVKGGRSVAGARAAGSHTGALAGPDAAVSALCRQAGIVRCDSLEEMFGAAQLFATQPLPRGKRVGVVTNAGGPGILVADALESAGLSLPLLSDASRESLRARLRPAASVGNPVDVLADATPAEYRAALEAVLRDPNVDSVVAVYVPPATQDAAAIAAAVVEVTEARSKPVLTCFLGARGVAPALQSLAAGQVPHYRFPEGAVRALAHAWHYAEFRAQHAQLFDQIPEPPDAAQSALQQARARLGPEGGWLSNEECAALAEAWGLPLSPQRRVAPGVDLAVAAARELGLPVVLKAEVPGLIHKSEAGAVAVGLREEDQVRAAAARMLGLGPTSLLVQRHLESGQEWLVGAVRHERYGPLIAAGAGGTRAELWRDVEQRLAPLSELDVEALLERPRVGQLLDGFRGAPAGDRDALARFVRLFARLASAHPELAEIEANPVLVLRPGEGVRAVDLRVRLAPAR
jgi:acetyl coenzyme A synthetase (ADP forming)-like protein